MELRALTTGTAAFAAAREYAFQHFDRALLFLGDSSAPLVRRSRLFCVTHAGELHGVAVRFEGFETPTVSCAADDEQACAALIDAARPRAACTIVTHETQPLPAAILPAVTDTWLDCACDMPATETNACRLDDPHELVAFCKRHGARYVLPEMLELGHAFGVRDGQGQLLAIGLLHFALADRSYTQLGGFLTAPNARGRGHATRLLAAIRCSLAAAGFTRCGLFADAPDPTLPAFYIARGFQQRGRFHFRALPERA